MYSDSTAASLKSNALFACSVYVVRLNFNAKQRTYFIDNGHTSLRFLLVGNGKMEIEGKDAGLDKELC